MPGDPMAPQAGGGDAVAQSKQQLQQLVQTLMRNAQQKQQSQVPPTPRYSKEETSQQGYDMSHNTGAADVGQALGNFGVFVNNMVAKHKENQINDATGVWRKLAQAHEKAIAAAGEGDPKDPEYQKKVSQIMMSDPLVADLDPAKNPKAMKHIKNMKAAFDYNLLEGPDEENVYHKGLERHFKIQSAFQKMMGAKSKMDAHSNKKDVPQPPSPEQQKQAFQNLLGRFNEQSTTSSAPDPKQQMETAKIGIDLQRAEEGAKTLDNEWYQTKTKEDGHPPTSAEVEAHQQSKALKPIDQHIQKAMDAASSGDWETAEKEFKIAHAGAETKRISAPNTWEVIRRANSGDKEAQGMLAKDVAMRKEIAGAYGAGRAMYNMGNYVDENGTPITMSALDAAKKIREGQKITYISGLSATQVTQLQRLKSEGVPAVEAVNQYVKAFDNPSNRKVFARVLANPPQDEEGFIPWAKNAMDQALKSSSELDPDGRKMVVRLKRLADTLGTLRAALGLPSTEASIHLMMQLMPGATTPDSEMAKDIMDQLEQTMNNAVDIPMYKRLQGQDKKRPVVTDKKELD